MIIYKTLSVGLYQPRCTSGDVEMGRPRRFLMGVHSETLILDRDPEVDEPLGLNFVWYANLIPEIINSALWQMLH